MSASARAFAALPQEAGAVRAAVDPLQKLWAVVLAGGDGVRLRPLTRIVCGDERPKQYAPILDSRSLLRLTLDRVSLAVPPARTVIVTKRAHAGYMSKELMGGAPPSVLVQPEDRGTAAAILLAAHWVQRRDPDALLAVFPSDHYVAEESAFMAHVAEVGSFVAQEPGRCVLLGVRPMAPESGYGWIGPGEPLGRIAGEPIYRVRRFWEKPSRNAAQIAFTAGCLWNTFVFVARPTTLIAAGAQHVPALSERLAALASFLGGEDEPWAIQQAYALAPSADFSRAILEAAPSYLAVAKLPHVGWSDWGTPQRVVRSLCAAGITPSWLEAFAAAGAEALQPA